MEQEKGCSKCKKGFSTKQWYLVGLSLYILVASIYTHCKSEMLPINLLP